jgi:hypothetical protein
MKKLDPEMLFARLACDIPRKMHGDFFVAGSLAAAYRFRAELEDRAVNTKDADLVIHPSGNAGGCERTAKTLLKLGWTRTEECYSQPECEPINSLRAIRLYPPDSRDYFLEFLGLPPSDQREPKRWIPLKIIDGWYGLPCFRFAGLMSFQRLKSEVGIEYAAPATMALANLLSHPAIGPERIESGPMRGILRSAKDLGRAIALAHLSERKETEKWPEIWHDALAGCFPADWKTLANHVGSGLMALVKDSDALEEARQTTEMGLLKGLNISTKTLKADGLRLIVDAIEPFIEQFAQQ